MQRRTLTEIIEDGRTGLLVTMRQSVGGRRAVDVDDLTGAQLELLDDPIKARSLGRAGRELLSGRFGFDAMTRSTMEAYRAARPHAVGARRAISEP